MKIVLALEKSAIAVKIAEQLRLPLYCATITRFADGEIAIRLPSSVNFSQSTVYFIHATCPPVDERLMQAILIAHELCNAQVAKIIGVMPYFGYARHDKAVVSGGRPPVAAIIKMLECAGYSRIVAVELHNQQIIDLFDIPVTNIKLEALIADLIAKNLDGDVCLVAPDKGARARVDAIAQLLKLKTINFTKERIGTDHTRVVAHQAHCTGKTAIIIDDMIDSGGTALAVCDELKKIGFASIHGVFIHPVLSGKTLQRIEESCMSQIFVSNSIELKQPSQKIQVFDISNAIVNLILK